MKKEWQRYKQLMKERPEKFADCDSLKIITDEEIVSKFEAETGLTIGVLYESDFHILVVDLVQEQDSYHTYERLLQKNTGGCVIVPIYENRFVFLKQFRHATRSEVYAFPRGFGEKNLTSKENAYKELEEELQAQVLDIKKLGSVILDAGFSDKCADIYLCSISEPNCKTDYEGIKEICLWTKEEVERKIDEGILEDAYSIVAWQLYQRKEMECVESK